LIRVDPRSRLFLLRGYAGKRNRNQRVCSLEEKGKAGTRMDAEKSEER
jgi:hypothetical protein